MPGGKMPDVVPVEKRVIDPSTGGAKGQKLVRMDLLPVLPEWEWGLVYGMGAHKYADRNWEKGYAWSLSYGAAKRHLAQFWAGESRDKEGFHHLGAVMFHAAALIEFEQTHPELDDRSRKVVLP